MAHSPRTADSNQWAFAVAAATTDPLPEKNPAAVALGRLGGLKGGKARTEALSPVQRSQIAKKGGLARAKARKEASVVALLQQGVSANQIAAKVGISPPSVRKIKEAMAEKIASGNLTR